MLSLRIYCSEYVRGGELFTHLCSRGSFDVAAAKFIIAELIIAIDSLHQVCSIVSVSLEDVRVPTLNPIIS